MSDTSLVNARTLIVPSSCVGLVSEMLSRGIFANPVFIDKIGTLYTCRTAYDYYLLLTASESIPAFVVSLSLLSSYFKNKLRYNGVTLHFVTEALSRNGLGADVPFIAQIDSFSIWDGSNKIPVASDMSPLLFPKSSLDSLVGLECVSGLKEYKSLSWSFLKPVDVYDKLSAFFAEACHCLSLQFSVVCLCISSTEATAQRKLLPSLLSRYFVATL